MAAGDFIPELWAGSLLKNWDESFVWGDIVNRNLEGEISGPGDTLHAMYLGDITVSTYAGTVTYQTLDENEDTLVIDQQDYWAFNVDDIDKVQMKPELRKNYTKRGMIGFKREVEQFIMGSTVYAAAGLSYASQTTAGDSAAVAASNIYDILVALRQLFEDANTWVEGEMWVTLPPVLFKYIRLSTTLTHATEKGDKFLRDGKLTKLADWNLMPVSAGNLTGDGSDGTPYHLLAGNREAVHFAEQINKVEAVRREGTFGTGVRALMVYGAKVFAANANCLCDWAVETT